MNKKYQKTFTVVQTYMNILKKWKLNIQNILFYFGTLNLDSEQPQKVMRLADTKQHPVQVLQKYTEREGDDSVRYLCGLKATLNAGPL